MSDLPHPASALVERWGSYLAHDRRRSPHTVRAYQATAHRLIDFLGSYRGEAIEPDDLTDLAAPDLRAFLANRRSSGLGASSAARELSGVRAFLAEEVDQPVRRRLISTDRVRRSPPVIGEITPPLSDQGRCGMRKLAHAAIIPFQESRRKVRSITSSARSRRFADWSE